MSWPGMPAGVPPVQPKLPEPPVVVTPPSRPAVRYSGMANCCRDHCLVTQAPTSTYPQPECPTCKTKLRFQNGAWELVEPVVDR